MKMMSLEDEEPKLPEEKSTEEEKTYMVRDGDTLNKIAAMHDTTPSKITQVNKMSTRYIFPGQVLKLPPPEPPKPVPEPPPIEKDAVDLNSKFMRINVRHITEGRGIVDGTLLLTSKLVMFDPYSHHPLVQESNVDLYQVILPAKLVVNAVILNDFLKNSDEEPSLIFHKPENKTKDENDDDDEKENESENEQVEEVVPEKLLYLRIRMGQPIGSKIKRDEMINTYGDAKVLPDYWFILTNKRAELVYDFFHLISDEFKIYGVLDVVPIERAGLELVREGREAVEAEAGRTVNRASVSKLEKSHMSFASVDFCVLNPMVGDSELMSKEERIYLAKVMPPKLDGHTWVLVYSTSNDGFSLKNMMRKLSKSYGSMLLVLSDLKGHVFGAFLSGVPSLGEHFDGTGETFLFQLRPQVQSFHWTGENNFFYRVDNECLIIGSSRGKFGLWIDRDINKGRSQQCATFDNAPLATDEDFTVKTLECWTFEMA